jgi:hypothetical protein
LRLERPTDEDRSKWEGSDGLLMRRLNAPWTPDLGALWEVRFDAGDVVVFSESELAVVRSDGTLASSGIEAVREDWGEAPRTPSLPFRRFAAGSGSAPAVLALIVFAIAGVLLVWAGVSESSLALAGAGALLVLIGIGAAGVLIR